MDLAAHFTSKRSLQSIQLRAYSNLVVLGMELNRVMVQVQYLSPKEIDRRRKSRLKNYGCNCPDGYDEHGICQVPISPVDQWSQDRNIGDHIVTLSAEWNVTLFEQVFDLILSKNISNQMSIFWDLLGIDGVSFIFATPVKRHSDQNPYMVLSGKLNVLFLRNIGGYIDIQVPEATFNMTTKVAGLFKVEISGKSF